MSYFRLYVDEAQYSEHASPEDAEAMTAAALLADGLILVDASGLIVTLDVTRTSGTLYYTAVPLLG